MESDIIGAFNPLNSNKLRTIEKYQLLLLCWDVLCNLIIDCSAHNPLTVLILFVLQCIPLFINLVLCGVSAASHALQYGIQSRFTIHYHELNLSTIVTYIILTFWWYIWTMRRLWPSVGDQFSFTYSDYRNDSRLAQVGGRNDNMEQLDEVSFAGREQYTLWSTGFIALYTVQRTVATIYYIVYVKSIFVLLNQASLSDEIRINSKGYPEQLNARSTHPTTPRAASITTRPTVKTISELLVSNERRNEIAKQSSESQNRENSSPRMAVTSIHNQHQLQIRGTSSSPRNATATPRSQSSRSSRPDHHHHQLRFKDDDDEGSIISPSRRQSRRHGAGDSNY